MNGHDEETYENKDLPTAFISREEHERILKEYKEKLKHAIRNDLSIRIPDVDKFIVIINDSAQ